MNKETVRLCNPYDLTTGGHFSSIQHRVTDFYNFAKCVYCAVGTEYILFHVGVVTKVRTTAHSNIYPTRCKVTQFILPGNFSTCFGWYHPSPGAQTTVSAASGICHAVTAICRYRGRVGTGLSVLYPSSGAHTTVSAASGICHAVTAIRRYRGRVGTGLSVLWVAYATHNTLKPPETCRSSFQIK
jgi:hypothetical protein